MYITNLTDDDFANKFITLTCNNCNIEFQKRKNEVRKKLAKGHTTAYCSVSCANKHKPRRKPTKSCKHCGKIINSRTTYCSNICKYMSSSNRQKIYPTTTKHDAIIMSAPTRSKYATIRSNSRKLYKLTHPLNCCECCGRNGHIDVCHIKPISSFSDKALVSEINSQNNLIGLCKNCHWDLDHIYGTIEQLFAAHEPVPIYI